jgi:transposase
MHPYLCVNPKQKIMDAYKTSALTKKHVMWYKVNEFRKKGLNFSQISLKTGLHRCTVSKYAHMSEEEFLNSQSYRRQYNHKLDPYEEFVRNSLTESPFLSAAQIEDWLKERYADFPSVNSKTVFNFVRYIRRKYDLSKSEGHDVRAYAKLPETPYGEYGQVDFGEQWMKRDDGRRLKVYFFVMVLSRSRQKFVYVSQSPFTTAKTVYAHELAFAYYGGKPKNLIYDQDKVLITDENLGDIILTRKFSTFVASEHLQVTFCRKSDPESKGKVENAVKYVKYNFLRGRRFYSVDRLQQEVLAWLDRTGNGTVNGSTHRIPKLVFEEEQKHLIPYTGVPTEPVENEMKIHHVRKDNTITYKGNFYSLPLGTYRGANTRVWVNESDGSLVIYSNDTGKVTAIHRVAEGKGMFICKPEHVREQYETNDDMENEIRSYIGNDDFTSMWLHHLHESKKRYYLDNIRLLSKGMRDYAQPIIHKALTDCLDRRSYNARMLLEVAETIKRRSAGEIKPEHDTLPEQAYITPDKTSIAQYNNLFI